MLHKNSIDDVVLALDAAPVDPRTGNRVLYSVDWVADKDSMIGEINPDWVRRELDWFNLGSDRLSDMEGPVPKLFQACAGADGRVNSAYGYVLFNQDATRFNDDMSLYERALLALLQEGPATRHSVVIVSDRDIHRLSRMNERNDFICTNALNFMVDTEYRVNIIAQMRSMDAVFGYRADYSMWDNLMDRLVTDLNLAFGQGYPEFSRGDITFQVANLHVYPRHFELLADTAADTQERLDRRVWQAPTFSERHTKVGADGVERMLKPTAIVADNEQADFGGWEDR